MYRYSIYTLLVTTSIVAVFVAIANRSRLKDRLPETWNLVEITDAALRDGETAIASDVLVWQIKEDCRPRRVESCIMWLHLADQIKPKWRISHLGRTPLERRNQWENYIVWDGPYIYYRDFDHPPSSAEILSFVSATCWTWELNEFDDAETMRVLKGFKYLDGRVCLSNWKIRTGEAFELPIPSAFVR